MFIKQKAKNARLRGQRRVDECIEFSVGGYLEVGGLTEKGVGMKLG